MYQPYTNRPPQHVLFPLLGLHTEKYFCNLHRLKDKKEWKGTDVLWEIVPMKGATEILMTHIGLKPGIECFEDCTVGWNHYVKESLFKLLNEGKGVPDHPNHSARDRQ